MTGIAVPDLAPSTLATVARAAPGSNRVRPILIADDDPVARLLVQESLRLLGLDNPCVEACDGAEAIDELRRLLALGPASVPAIVLLDRHMGKVGGLEVLRWMRSTRGLEGLPVVMLTGDDAMDGVTEAYALDVASYLIKPVGFGALAAVVTGLHLPWRLT